ncbi:glycosyltransferase [Streptomyces olivoreticuli]|uniref:glycosyltransferase n=1 Tax=Streptomyces olivoreticuli TaxID=68246 RepID=UPI00265A9751|nr:glycosyltransferase [Streptomyces olivoreticuli]WKK24179.1 glycosyltransferase [Streptomyces olivoreticuli]
MHVLIAAAGSHGDVVPFVGLGHRLAAAGYEVSLATHAAFEASVRGAGLEFRGLPVNPRAELASEHGQRLLRSGAGPACVVRALRFGRRFMPELGRGLLDAVAEGCDLVLLSATTAPLGQVVAEGMRLPSAGLSLQPLAPTAEFFPAVAGSAVSLGRYGNRIAGGAAQLAVDRLFAPTVGQLRRQLGLPAETAGRMRRRHADRGWPVFHGFSPLVVPRPADWAPSVSVAGYWWPHQEPGWRPSDRLCDFLQAGPPPVFVGFGSLVVDDGDWLSRVVAGALRAARVRAVVQRGWSGLSLAGDDVLMVDEVPHAWLFPRVAAVVHHAGAGTTGAGLRAGVPSVAVPAQLDAPFWAARLAALGVGPEPVPLRELSAGRLAAALRQAVGTPAYGLRAQALADRLKTEDGARDVLEFARQTTAIRHHSIDTRRS